MNQDIKVIGMDVSDKKLDLCLLDAGAQILDRITLGNTAHQIKKWFSALPPRLIALETGAHSPWIARLLKSLGHEVIIANARSLRVIYKHDRKTDQRDAEMLARIALMDPKLLSPITPRDEQMQRDRGILDARDHLVRARTQLVNYIRGFMKSLGVPLRKCAVESFVKCARASIPQDHMAVIAPLLDTIENMSVNIKTHDKLIEEVSRDRYPETWHLRDIPGVGPIVSLYFVLCVGNVARFERSREVGPYFGLTPRQNQSGDQDRRSGITKSGNTCMRRLLIQSATYILGPLRKDSDPLRQWGLDYAHRGGPVATKKARVAVARKLATLMVALLKSGERYDPQYRQQNKAA